MGIGAEIFAAATASSRKLWLRALSNVKVKIQNREPEPSINDVAGYRESVRGALHRMEATAEQGRSGNSNSLLMLQSWSAGVGTRNDSATKHAMSPASRDERKKDRGKVSM